MAPQSRPPQPKPTVRRPAADEILAEPLLDLDEAPAVEQPVNIQVDAQALSEDILYADDDSANMSPQQLAAAARRPTVAMPTPRRSTRRQVRRVEDLAAGPEPDVIPEAEPLPQARSARQAAPPVRGSVRRVAEMAAAAPAGRSPSTRRSKRVSQALAPVRPLLTKKQMIFGGVLVVLILVAVLGFNPLMYSLTISALEDSTAALDSRKVAAQKLVNQWTDRSYEQFCKLLQAEDADSKAVSAYGLQLLVDNNPGNKREAGNIIARLGKACEKADAASRGIYIDALAEITKRISGAPGDIVSAEDANAHYTAMAENLLPLSNSAVESSEELRGKVVDILAQLRVPGVCQQLLKVAGSEKGAVRFKALYALSFTALPEAAGALIRAMGSVDKELAEAAKKAFVAVRDGAKSEDLLPLVGDPADSVRREIVQALGKRNGDMVAARGIMAALKDAVADIRLMAIKAVPVTGIGGSMDPIAALVRDPDEKVRVATAETLGQLRDPESCNVLLNAFKENLQGETMNAFVLALGKRNGSKKDAAAIGIVMKLFETSPQAQPCLRQAMVLLTLAGQGAARENARRDWSAQRWKSWYENYLRREKLYREALDLLHGADLRKQEDKRGYPELLKITDQGLEKLEKCVELSRADDPEDIPTIESKQQKYTVNRYLFAKSQSLDYHRK